MVHLTRRYHFCSAHRLHSEALSAEDNRRVYGKCNNPHGHGHNYVLEVTVAGPVDPATGMVFDLAGLDRTVAEEVIERFDHKNLNLDVEIFRSLVPTTENLCIEIFNLLAARLNGSESQLAGRLARVRLDETALNFFEYQGATTEGERKERG